MQQEDWLIVKVFIRNDRLDNNWKVLYFRVWAVDLHWLGLPTFVIPKCFNLVQGRSGWKTGGNQQN